MVCSLNSKFSFGACRFRAGSFDVWVKAETKRTKRHENEGKTMATISLTPRVAPASQANQEPTVDERFFAAYMLERREVPSPVVRRTRGFTPAWARCPQSDD